jgi:hypothetical protein
MTRNPRPNPYVGPRAFRTGEAFYGRDNEIRQLRDLLVSGRIVLLHSPSGAGKTSLVRAGLIPELVKMGFAVLPVIRVNQELPAGAPKGTNRYIHSALVSLQENQTEIYLENQPELSLETYLDQIENTLKSEAEAGS